MQNLFTQFAAAFPADLQQVLLITPEGRSFSYADAERESARLAHYLSESGLRMGDRVTVQTSKSPQTVWLYLACLRGGFVYHPLNPAYQSSELEYLIADAKPKLVICPPERVSLFSDLTRDPACRVLTMDASGAGSLANESRTVPATFDSVACQGDTMAVLLYSSGTTGKPKGAMLTHRNLATNIRTLISAWDFTAKDRLLHALPIYHAHGLFVALGCVLMSGASMIFLPKFDARTVIHHLPDATVMMGIPTFYTRLLHETKFNRECCASIRLFISGSAPLLAETHREFEAQTGHAILERYGMTETCMNSSSPLVGERRPGSVGPALPGITIRITDDADAPLPAGEIGEIQVKGPNVFAGYWGMPDKTAQEFTADKFFRSGDLGTLSDDGYLSIRGRKKDMIISGGLNVYPREVEQVLDELQGVAESAVVGVPHPDFGEGVIAVIVPDPGQPATEEHLIASVRAKLADFKTPKRVFFTQHLPRNAMGKVRKSDLREQYNGVLS